MLMISLIYTFSQLFLILLLYIPTNLKIDMENNWVIRIILNLLGYATIFIPGFILYLYVKKTKLAERPGNKIG